MKDGFLRVACCTPTIRVADPTFNANEIVQQIRKAPKDTAVLVFPELCLTGYTTGDLFFQQTLLQSTEYALEWLLSKTVDVDTVILIGLPIAVEAAIFNCAAVCHRGNLLGLIPKTHLPNYAQFYEARHFTSGHEVDMIVRFAGQQTRLCARQLFACKQHSLFRFGVEICEDLWVSEPPSGMLAKAGATILVNLSASDESVGKPEYRRQLVKSQSARLCCAYLYADAGEGESTTDLVFSGHNLIAENGALLKESKPFTQGMISTEIDLQRLAYERRRISTFCNGETIPTVWFDFQQRDLQLTREIEQLPFVPHSEQDRQARCEEILTIQASGLATRLKHIGCSAVVGLSGGLDSALALLVTLRAYERIGKPTSEIYAVTMPCFGTTGRTLNNARVLAKSCGATLREIDISQSVKQHFEDISHNGELDVTFENSQARERTQVLMDLANTVGAIVIGTGDMSELALGWATYNGDHMSMYGVNASIPKTLVRYLVAYESARLGGEAQKALNDILDTPVSPELLPPKDGNIAQKTEQIVGPYELHDFFLYYLLRFGFTPQKIYRLAILAFQNKFDKTEIIKWLTVFIRRFFSQQFKRSCMPDGPRVGSIALSPRGDWRMPSDASASEWLKSIELEKD